MENESGAVWLLRMHTSQHMEAFSRYKILLCAASCRFQDSEVNNVVVTSQFPPELHEKIILLHEDQKQGPFSKVIHVLKDFPSRPSFLLLGF